MTEGAGDVESVAWAGFEACTGFDGTVVVGGTVLGGTVVVGGTVLGGTVVGTGGVVVGGSVVAAVNELATVSMTRGRLAAVAVDARWRTSRSVVTGRTTAPRPEPAARRRIMR